MTGIQKIKSPVSVYAIFQCWFPTLKIRFPVLVSDTTGPVSKTATTIYISGAGAPFRAPQVRRPDVGPALLPSASFNRRGPMARRPAGARSLHFAGAEA
jgi:hypothetical protein